MCLFVAEATSSTLSATVWLKLTDALVEGEEDHLRDVFEGPLVAEDLPESQGDGGKEHARPAAAPVDHLPVAVFRRRV